MQEVIENKAIERNLDRNLKMHIIKRRNIHREEELDLKKNQENKERSYKKIVQT